MQKWRRKRCIFLVFAAVFVPCFLYYRIERLIGADNFGKRDRPPPDHRLAPNNLLLQTNTLRLRELELLVNTTNCQIPDFALFEDDVVPLVKPNVNPRKQCHLESRNWSYILEDDLVIHTEQMQRDGFTFSQDFCCYKTVTRDQDYFFLLLKEADRSVLYSDCQKIQYPITPIDSQFLMVECGTNDGVQYRGFHATTNLQDNPRKSIIERKKSQWKGRTKTPPNILILGIDTTSRLNFRRFMNKTMSLLEEMKSVEMKGYHKVGQNTFPNVVSTLTGYSEEEYGSICLVAGIWKIKFSNIPYKYAYQDDCPLIWKLFDEAHYLTGFAEDDQIGAAFVNSNVGFRNQPTDFYLRPLVLAASDFSSVNVTTASRVSDVTCFGPLTNDELLLQYAQTLLDYSRSVNTPLFHFHWSTVYTHDDFNMLKLLDDKYHRFLQNVKAKGHLENTIVILMGDHGAVFGDLRATLSGTFESNLPAMWVYLPEAIKKTKFQWADALSINKDRLTSHYHVYWTLRKVLDDYSTVGRLKDEMDDDVTTPRKYRQNFLDQVPENNSCSDVGTPDHFCSCYTSQILPLDDPRLQEATKHALSELNNNLPNETCHPLTLTKLLSGSAIDLHKSNNYGIRQYTISFQVGPGRISIQADVKYRYVVGQSNDVEFAQVSHIQRVNKIDKSLTTCLKGSAKERKLELYCICMES